MKVGHQRLQAFFVHIVSKIADGGGQDKAEEYGAEDDHHFDPFQAGDKGDGEEEDVSGEGNKDSDHQSVFGIEWEVYVVVPNGKQDHQNDDGGEYPPE